LVEQLIRNQQVVGSNPTGGSRKSSKYKALKVHLGGHSVHLSCCLARSLASMEKDGYFLLSNAEQELSGRLFGNASDIPAL
jgi:hypothetical protein